MALLKSTRQAQYPQFADFKFSMADTMVDVNGAITGFKSAAGVFEPIPLPPNSIIIGGDVTVETASDDSVTATIAIGDSITPARYLAATNIKALARTPLVPTGYRTLGENLRITLANAGANATVGTVSIRLEYIIQNRMHETVIV
jgi:hypothetical protein